MFRACRFFVLCIKKPIHFIFYPAQPTEFYIFSFNTNLNKIIHDAKLKYALREKNNKKIEKKIYELAE